MSMMSATDQDEIPQKQQRLSEDSLKAECVPSQPEVVVRRHLLYETKFFTSAVSSDGSKGAECSTCKKVLSAEHNHNLVNHLKNVHPAEYEKYLQHSKSKEKKSVSRQRSSYKFSQELFNENVTMYILETTAPLNTVEEKPFRKIFNDLNIRNGDKTLEHMTKDSLIMRFREMCKKSLDEIRQIVAGTEHVCTTVGVWSGGNGRFLGMTLHWIEEETYVRKSAAIACKHFPGPRGHKTREIHYNLTLDSGSIFVEAFKENGVDALDSVLFGETSVNGEKSHIVEDFLSDDSASEDNFSKQCRSLVRHLRCASHTLQHVATTDIKPIIKQSGELSRVLEKCESFWGSLWSPKVKNSLRSYLDSDELIEPVATRWKSSFDAYKQLVTLKTKQLLISPGNTEGRTLEDTFTQSDFKHLSEYIASTTPVAKAIDRLRSETHCHYGCLLPTLANLKKELKLLRNDPKIITCQPLVEGMIEALKTRFKNMFEIAGEGIDAAIAAVSHPKSKVDWVQYLSPKAQKRVYLLVTEAVEAQIRPKIPLDPMVDELDDGDDFGNGTCVWKDAEDQRNKYLADRDEEFKMLKNHPAMEKIFRKYNTPLPSSAPVERLFNYAALSDDHFEERVLLAANKSEYYSRTATLSTSAT